MCPGQSPVYLTDAAGLPTLEECLLAAMNDPSLRHNHENHSRYSYERSHSVAKPRPLRKQGGDVVQVYSSHTPTELTAKVLVHLALKTGRRVVIHAFHKPAYTYSHFCQLTPSKLTIEVRNITHGSVHECPSSCLISHSSRSQINFNNSWNSISATYCDSQERRASLAAGMNNTCMYC